MILWALCQASWTCHKDYHAKQASLNIQAEIPLPKNRILHIKYCTHLYQWCRKIPLDSGAGNRGRKMAGHYFVQSTRHLGGPVLNYEEPALFENSPSASICAYTHGGGVCSMHAPVWGYVFINFIFNYRNSMGTPAPTVPVVPTPLCIDGIQVSIYFGFAGLIDKTRCTHTFLSLITRSCGSMENWPGIYCSRMCKQFHCIYRKNYCHCYVIAM